MAIVTEPASVRTGLPTKARILVISGPRELDYLDRVMPQIGRDDVLVQTLYSAISHGTEMNVYRGHAPQWSKYFDPELHLFMPVDQAEIQAAPPRGYWTSADRHWNYPLAYGYANVGRVLACGAGVTTIREGAIVYGYQPHQDFYVSAADRLIILPDLPNPACGVLWANLNTAYGGVLDSDIRLDDTVVIFGQGMIGLLVTQFARRAGAGQVITVETIPDRRVMSQRLGADVMLDPAGSDVALAVRSMTDGRGADVVIDASGSYAALHEAVRTAAPNTTVTALSWYGGSAQALRLSDEFHHNRITIKCSQVGGIDPALQATHSTNRRAQQIARAFTSLTLEPLLTDFVPFEEAPRAYELVDGHGDQTIQVVLSYQP